MSTRSTHPLASAGMFSGPVLLFALADGTAVGNLYWAQPFLARITDASAVDEGVAGVLVSATQLGYALGVFLIVPPGDVEDRRRLIPAPMSRAAAALAGSAAAQGSDVLVAALIAVDLTTVSGQLLRPLAGDLVEPERRSRVTGTVVSGLLTGILLPRTISGVLATLLGWRAVYTFAASASAAVALLLAIRLPLDVPRPAIPHPTLLASVVGAVRRHRAVRATPLLGATAFAVLTMFWTGLGFPLGAPPSGRSLTRIGLVGLLGMAGAPGTRRSGVLHDRASSVPAIGAALALPLVAVVPAASGGRSIAAVLVAVLLPDVAIQAVNVLNQTRLLSMDPMARSRLDTAFVTGDFVSGAIGSALAGLLWGVGSWAAVMVGAAVLLAFAPLVWAVRRGALNCR